MSKDIFEIKNMAPELSLRLKDCTKDIVESIKKYFPEVNEVKRNFIEHGDNLSIEARVLMCLYIELIKCEIFNKEKNND